MNFCAYTLFHSDTEFLYLPLIYEDISQVITSIGINELFSNFTLLNAKKKILTMQCIDYKGIKIIESPESLANNYQREKISKITCIILIKGA